jgi:hypothetical protein
MIDDFPLTAFGNLEDRDDDLEQAILRSRESFLEEQRRQSRILQEQKKIATENDSVLRSIRSRISWRIRFASNQHDSESWSTLAEFVDRVRALNNERGQDIFSASSASSASLSIEDVRNASQSMNHVVISEPDMDQYRQLGEVIQQIQQTVR